MSNPIRNCPVEFKKPCPMKWDALQPTADATQRHCDICQKRVYLCANDAEIMAHARAGDCVAWPEPDLSNLPENMFVLGQPDPPPPPPTPEQERALNEFRLDRAKTTELNKLKYSSRFCPDCGFPCPDWYPECRVCGYPVGRTWGNDKGKA